MQHKDLSDTEDFEYELNEADEVDIPNSDVENVKVAIRVRPPLPRELGTDGRPFQSVVRCGSDHRSITLCEHLDFDDGKGAVYSTQSFSFDYVYDTSARQRDVYERSAQPAVRSVLQGYNATLIAYGQTGTGKTYTMDGFAQSSEDHRGIIPRATEDIFAYIVSGRNATTRFLVRASYLQIYNEVLSDLLGPQAGGKQLTIRHCKQRGVYVEGLSEWVVRSPHEVYELIERGCSLRATGSTRLSELSSRSHAIFLLVVEVMEGDPASPKAYRMGKLNIVDLAGSEKVRQTGVTGVRLEETKKINRSLHELGNVIAALTDTKRRDKHVPFRNSCLTRALRGSLGGNCKTTLIACISPALDSYGESLSTLKFANRAKNIRNDATINEELDQTTLLKKYERELRRLRQTLHEREHSELGDSAVSQLELSKRRAEEDRAAALTALQRTTQEVHEEKVTRQRLESRIEELEAKLGGPAASEVAYSQRLGQLDRERQAMEEDKAQVDRYKQLLLKQRDIMLSLTTRVNEREETILSLQDELDAYDAHVFQLESASEAARSITTMTRAQAMVHLQNIRVTVRGEEKYKSEVEGADDVLLTPEEKLLELFQRSRLSDVSFSPGQLPLWGFSREDRREFRALLHSRLDSTLTSVWQERCAQLLNEVEQLREGKHSPSVFSSAAMNHQRWSSSQCSVGDEELKQQNTSLKHQLLEARESHRRLLGDVNKIRCELSQIRRAVSSKALAGVDTVTNATISVENALKNEVLKHLAPTAVRTIVKGLSNSNTEGSNGHENPNGDDIATMESLKTQNAELHVQVQQLDRCLRRMQEEEQQRTQRRTTEFSQLERALHAHEKDRQALKTILESRVKVKVDTINELLLVPTGGERERLLHEARGLQSLINASISAMEREG